MLQRATAYTNIGTWKTYFLIAFIIVSVLYLHEHNVDQ